MTPAFILILAFHAYQGGSVSIAAVNGFRHEAACIKAGNEAVSTLKRGYGAFSFICVKDL